MSNRRETPWERWSRDTRELQHLTEEQLTQAFVTHFERSATNDRLVPIDGVLYELPLALGAAGRGGAKVQITHRLLEETYHVVCDGRLVRIHPVDVHANAHSPRSPRAAGSELTTPPVKTAADMAFDRDLGPVLDDDGGALPAREADDDDDDDSPLTPQEA